MAEKVNESLGKRRDSLLFSATGSQSVYTRTATGWIQSFIEFVNTRLAPHTVSPEAYAIPEGLDGQVTLRRFRRTLAWFLRHRPNGDVTTAVQYQHVGVTIGEGYAGTKASGIPSLLLEEDWNHRRDTLGYLDDFMSQGKAISGPAAERALRAVGKLPRQLLPADERRLRKDKELMVYDNPASIALCVYREDSALCQKLSQAGKDTRPDLLGCVEGCRNIARTDDHLEELRRQARSLRDQAEVAPVPIAQSMRAQADRRERIVRDSGATRITLTSEHAQDSPSPSAAADRRA